MRLERGFAERGTDGMSFVASCMVRTGSRNGDQTDHPGASDRHIDDGRDHGMACWRARTCRRVPVSRYVSARVVASTGQTDVAVRTSCGRCARMTRRGQW